MKKTGAAVAAALVASLLFAAPARAGRTVTISGGGWGHGIGMSQYGAYGRARAGKSAARILKHYYRGISLATRDMPSHVRVGLLDSRAQITATSAPSSGDGKVIWREKGTSGRLAQGTASDTWKVEPSSTGGLRLYKNGTLVERDQRRVFGGPDRPLVLVYEKFSSTIDVSDKAANYSYGRIEASTHPSTKCGSYCLRLVVSLPMQKYLYGLGEMPSSWPQPALRAQAIAGRTYAYRKLVGSPGGREPCDCHVYDSVIDQAYIGDAKRTSGYWSNWKGAVDATNGRIATHNGDAIQALYSSSSGGHTENNENVWGNGTSSAAIPYLRGVRDRADKAGGANPNYRWSFDMTYRQFESRLDTAFGTGSLEDFEIVRPRGVSGRVTVVKQISEGANCPDGMINCGGVRIVGSAKTVRADGWSIRSALSLKDSLFWIDISYSVGSRLQQKYDSLGGAPGNATSAVYDVPRGSDHRLGRAQNFERGRMTWTASVDKVVWQWGRPLRKYNRLGRERSALGMPTSDTWGPGRYLGATYVRGLILWSKETGAHTVRKAFRSAYRRNGSVKGPLGLPIKEREHVEGLPRGGRRQRFQTGTLYKTPQAAVYALWGAIDRRYRRIGQASSRCGYPTGDMVAERDQAAAPFQNGVIVWNADAGVTVNCG